MKNSNSPELGRVQSPIRFVSFRFPLWGPRTFDAVGRKTQCACQIQGKHRKFEGKFAEVVFLPPATIIDEEFPPIPLSIQAELRKRPGVGMYTAPPDGSRQYRYRFKRSCASGPVLGITRLTGWHAPIPRPIQAELRKRPGVGMYTAPPDGSRQYRDQFKRSCASSPVLGCTRLTGWLAPIPLRMPDP
jgi:hypothetical protein